MPPPFHYFLLQHFAIFAGHCYNWDVRRTFSSGMCFQRAFFNWGVRRTRCSAMCFPWSLFQLKSAHHLLGGCWLCVAQLSLEHTLVFFFIVSAVQRTSWSCLLNCTESLFPLTLVQRIALRSSGTFLGRYSSGRALDLNQNHSMAIFSPTVSSIVSHLIVCPILFDY